MKRLLILITTAALLAPAAAEARKGKKSGSAFHYDETQDFSKHFDDEVKYDREHPKADDDGTASAEAPAPKKRRSHKRRKKVAEE